MTERTRISRDVRHYVIVIVVFGITGSIALLLARALLEGLLGLEGSLWSGPWSFRIAYLLLIPPSYSATLIVVGTEDKPFLAATDYMANKISGARKALIQDAGHASNIDQPEAFNSVLEQFLSGLS